MQLSENCDLIHNNYPYDKSFSYTIGKYRN